MIFFKKTLSTISNKYPHYTNKMHEVFAKISSKSRELITIKLAGKAIIILTTIMGSNFVAYWISRDPYSEKNEQLIKDNEKLEKNSLLVIDKISIIEQKLNRSEEEHHLTKQMLGIMRENQERSNQKVFFLEKKNNEMAVENNNLLETLDNYCEQLDKAKKKTLLIHKKALNYKSAYDSSYCFWRISVKDDNINLNLESDSEVNEGGSKLQKKTLSNKERKL